MNAELIFKLKFVDDYKTTDEPSDAFLLVFIGHTTSNQYLRRHLSFIQIIKIYLHINVKVIIF